MRIITIHLLKPGKGSQVTYRGVLAREEDAYMLVHARWERPTLDLGYVTFETDDHFYEHYYTDKWFNIFEIRSESGALKGWYCNITRPAHIDGDVITSEDLELDLYVSPDRTTVLRLDEDEFEARGFAGSDPLTYRAARAALDNLERMARAGEAPFS